MSAAPDPDDIVVDLLVSSDHRRVTIEDHRTWREILSQEHAAPVDPIDEAVEEGGEQ